MGQRGIHLGQTKAQASHSITSRISYIPEPLSILWLLHAIKVVGVNKEAGQTSRASTAGGMQRLPHCYRLFIFAGTRMQLVNFNHRNLLNGYSKSIIGPPMIDSRLFLFCCFEIG